MSKKPVEKGGQPGFCGVQGRCLWKERVQCSVRGQGEQRRGKGHWLVNGRMIAYFTGHFNKVLGATIRLQMRKELGWGRNMGNVVKQLGNTVVIIE